MAARLKERYEKDVRPQLVQRFSYSSVMQAPRIEKITVNMGVGEAKTNTALLDAASEQLGVITGQKPTIRRALTAHPARHSCPTTPSCRILPEPLFLNNFLALCI